MKKLFLVFLFSIPTVAAAFMGDEEISLLQQATSGWSTGERIAFWAGQFIDTPYDPDPDGEYVTRKQIAADERVDCMYHVFRSVELALGKDPADSVSIALDLRFHGKGLLEDGMVKNYEDRFRYGEDMIESGKWGKEITGELGRTRSVRGSRGRGRVGMVPKRDIKHILDRLRNGDLVFFVKDPSKRIQGEIVGHLGIVKVEEGRVYLISALGRKNRGGTVKKTLLSEYSDRMSFAGMRVSRLE